MSDIGGSSEAHQREAKPDCTVKPTAVCRCDVELLILERAEFRDRKKPTYFEHRDAHVHRWRSR